MRLTAFLAFGLLMTCAAAAQQVDFKTKQLPSFKTTQYPSNVVTITTAAAPGLDRNLVVLPQARADEDVCLFLRSYIFERHDGQAPVLKGETVCTSSNQNVIRKTKKRSAGVVPLVW